MEEAANKNIFDNKEEVNRMWFKISKRVFPVVRCNDGNQGERSDNYEEILTRVVFTLGGTPHHKIPRVIEVTYTKTF